IGDCLGIYTAIRAGRMPEAAAQVRMSDADVDHMICRYTRRAEFLAAGLAAARGDHDRAAEHLDTLIDSVGPEDLDAEHRRLGIHARILVATGLCDDDLYARSAPLWDAVLESVTRSGGGDPEDDHLFIAGALGYGRF